MKQTTFMDLLDVAWQDFKAHSPDALGLAVVIMHKDPDDELAVQMGSNVPPDVVKYAFTSLVMSWAEGRNDFTQIPHRPRKKVV
jgi:hypothetical protein